MLDRMASQLGLPRPPTASPDQRRDGPRVTRGSVLPLPADQVWLLMLRPATMLYALHGLLDFPRLKDRHDPIVEGESGTGGDCDLPVSPSPVAATRDRHRLGPVVNRPSVTGLLRRWPRTSTTM